MYCINIYRNNFWHVIKYCGIKKVLQKYWQYSQLSKNSGFFSFVIYPFFFFCQVFPPIPTHQTGLSLSYYSYQPAKVKAITCFL